MQEQHNTSSSLILTIYQQPSHVLRSYALLTLIFLIQGFLFQIFPGEHSSNRIADPLASLFFLLCHNLVSCPINSCYFLVTFFDSLPSFMSDLNIQSILMTCQEIYVKNITKRKFLVEKLSLTTNTGLSDLNSEIRSQGVNNAMVYLSNFRIS